MRNNIRLALMLVILTVTAGNAFCQEKKTDSKIQWPELILDANDRILILAPHPDDEVLACGGIIQKAKAMGLPLQIVFYTYGDNNEWAFLVYRKRPVIMPKAVRGMGLIRHDEALKADNFLGVMPEDIKFLGYPDFGTLSIWYRHWDKSPAFRSMLTKVRAVPYKNAFRPGAPYKGEEILKDLTGILKEFKPTKVFLSHPADHNVDHCSLYLFTRVAAWELEDQKQPEFYPYLVHYKKWPLLKGHRPKKKLEPPKALSKEISWEVDSLTSEEVDRKDEALKEHSSQYKSAAGYLESFVRSNELFGDFPLVNMKVNASSGSLSAAEEEGSDLFGAELTEVEKAAFIGVEQRRFYLENDYIVFSVKLSRPLGKGVGVLVSFFGYRQDTDFAKMPKLRLRLGALHSEIFDQKKQLSASGIKIIRKAKEITIRVPLKVLGEPEKILTSAITYLGNVSLDLASWRILELH
jgi:LmbE family N-acetylglucosaminyl deacetylase